MVIRKSICILPSRSASILVLAITLTASDLSSATASPSSSITIDLRLATKSDEPLSPFISKIDVSNRCSTGACIFSRICFGVWATTLV